MCIAPVATRSSTPATFVLFGLAGILLLGTFGCRSATDNQIDLLERELRSQEDYIYELEDYILEYSEKLRQCRSVEPYQIVPQSKPLQPELVEDHPREEPEDAASSEPPVDDHSNESLEPAEPASEPSESPMPIPDELDIPELELESVDPVGDLDELEREEQHVASNFYDHTDSQEPLFIPDPVELTATANDNDFVSTEGVSTEGVSTNGGNSTSGGHVVDAGYLEELLGEDPSDFGDRVAERLVITKIFRGESGTQPPSSLLTIVEARDANDEPVDFDGEASLMIMTADPDSPQRLKRWDFTAEETASAWQSSPLGDGYHLELPLDSSVLPDETVELWVRLLASDGRKLLAQLPFQQTKLTTANFEMEARELLAQKETEAAEAGAQPLKPLAAAKPTSADNRPRWRAATRQTGLLGDRLDASQTTQASAGWTSQPPGGREPLPAIAGRSASTVKRPDKHPRWSPSR